MVKALSSGRRSTAALFDPRCQADCSPRCRARQSLCRGAPHGRLRPGRCVWPGAPAISCNGADYRHSYRRRDGRADINAPSRRRAMRTTPFYDAWLS